MLGEIHVGTDYLAHEGGTKFYEVIRFYNVDAKKFVLVKRWGKTSGAPGGGECKVETFTSQRQLESNADKIITSKKGRGYVSASSTHGFNALGRSYKSGEDFYAALKKHYTTHAPISEILIGMGITELESGTVSEPENEIISETPTPEPDRDEDYGSW